MKEHSFSCNNSCQDEQNDCVKQPQSDPTTRRANFSLETSKLNKFELLACSFVTRKEIVFCLFFFFFLFLPSLKCTKIKVFRKRISDEARRPGTQLFSLETDTKHTPTLTGLECRDLHDISPLCVPAISQCVSTKRECGGGQSDWVVGRYPYQFVFFFSGI